MIAQKSIPVTPIAKSKIDQLNLHNLAFGKHFTDHMLEADYIDGEWTNVNIRPYQALTLEPSLAAIHYGQSIFEGIKAFKTITGEAVIFRPYDNFERFNKSATRMQMPTVPEQIFIDGLKQLVTLDSAWIPKLPEHSLYIRPFMFSTDTTLGVKPSDTYKFMVILSPTGPYYTTPMKIYVEEYYVRATPGGVGFSKNAGNYAAAMYATAQAKKIGYDQVLWTDALEHKYIQECGTMNVFFIINKTAYTPSLEQGTILAGVTRNSVMTILTSMGYQVVEKPIHINEVIEAYNSGSLTEIFGTGTAATISYIKELRYQDFVMEWDTTTWQAAPQVKQTLNEIKDGTQPDIHGWLCRL